MSRQLTTRQRDQVLQLLRAGAIDRESAKGPYEPTMQGCSPLVIGKLRDLQLADSRVVRQGRGSQFTAYWLTPRGVELASAFAAERLS